MTLVEAPHYILERIGGRQWTTAQEKSIAIDYPFDIHEEASDQFVTRTYLQFLWLPQSIVPLQFLVPSLRCVVDLPSSSQSPHCLHSLLDPLLQTARAITNKYQVELVKILQDGGGAGEMEETMMWYALHHEKTSDQGLSSKGPEMERQEPWMNLDWRQEWLERLEKREVQIQILLYMLKLSLPGPAPLVPKPKKRKRRNEAQAPSATPEERLESLMDKLSVLQLSSHLATNGPQINHNEKDWAQSFCEDIVETTFKPLLPDLCLLLRSKVFPDSPFSDTDTVTASGSPSPEPDEPHVDLQESVPAPVIAPMQSSKNSSRSLSRARSRSLSVSLAQEREERERSVSIGPGKKRVLNREVSMSRAFKPKPKPAPKASENDINSHVHDNGKSQPEKAEVILVEDTPQKPRTTSRRAPSQSQFNSTSSSNHVLGVRQSTQDLFGSYSTETDDDDAWMLDSSPDVLLLQPGRKISGDFDDEYEAVTFHTPSKKPCQRE